MNATVGTPTSAWPSPPFNPMTRAELLNLARSSIDEVNAAMRLHVAAVERLHVVVEQLAALDAEDEPRPRLAPVEPMPNGPRTGIGPAIPARATPLSFADPQHYPIDEAINQQILGFSAPPEDDSPSA